MKIFTLVRMVFQFFFKDITDRKKITKELQNAYERNKEILESISDAFYAIDKDFNLTYINAEAERLLGLNKEEAINKNIWEVFKPAYETKLYYEYIKAFKTKETQNFEYFYHPLKSWYFINAYPSENTLSIYFRDITEEKKNRKHMEKLNKELIERAKELEHINNELEQFAFIASHDLQEPLRMITCFMSQLKIKFGGELNDKANTYIDFAIDGGLKMRQIIIDLLEYSRAGTQLDYTEEINLNKMVNDITSLQRGVIIRKKAKIEIEDLPTIYFNKIGIQQVFQNIINNALKYCKEDSDPQIKIKCIEEKDHYQFIVSDNGIGIKQEYQNKIFLIFQRLHSKSEYSGNGLGLAICKKIIEKGGGRIWIESILGEGSQFHFTIPKNNIE